MSNEIVKRGILVVPQITLWSGTRKVDPSELGIDLPKNVVTPGTKRIFPKEPLAELSKIRSQTETVLSKVGAKFGRGVWCIDQEKAKQVKDELEEKQKEFQAKVDDLEQNFDDLFENWLDDVVDSKWRPIIQKASVSSGKALVRMGYQFSLVRINSPEGLEGVNDSMVSGLKQTLWNELSEIAHRAVEDGFGSQGRVSQRAKGTFRRIAEKAEALVFIDNRVSALSEHIYGVLEKTPKTGPIEGSDLTELQVLLNALSNPEQARKLAESVFKGNPAGAQLLPDPVTAVDADEDDDDSDASDVESEVSDLPSQNEAPVRRWF